MSKEAVPSVTSATDGEALWSVGTLLVIKANSEQTDSAFDLYQLTAATGYETPYHVHHDEDGVFYVLEGEIDCYYGDDGKNVFRAGPDDTIFLPRDVPHGFRVVSDEECRMLIQQTPAGLVKFFMEVGVPAERIETPPSTELDVKRLTEVSAKYHLEILGPLPE